MMTWQPGVRPESNTWAISVFLQNLWTCGSNSATWISYGGAGIDLNHTEKLPFRSRVGSTRITDKAYVHKQSLCLSKACGRLWEVNIFFIDWFICTEMRTPLRYCMETRCSPNFSFSSRIYWGTSNISSAAYQIMPWSSLLFSFF